MHQQCQNLSHAAITDLTVYQTRRSIVPFLRPATWEVRCLSSLPCCGRVTATFQFVLFTRTADRRTNDHWQASEWSPCRTSPAAADADNSPPGASPNLRRGTTFSSPAKTDDPAILL